MSFLRRIFSRTIYEGLDDFLTNYVRLRGKGNVNELQQHIKKESREVANLILRCINSRQENTLHKAALQGERELVECLLTAIPPPTLKLVLSATDCDGNTALLLAASAGHTEIVKYILQCFEDETRYDMLADINNHGDTALLCAAFYGQEETVAFIMAATSSNYQQVQRGNRLGDTALHRAAFNGHTKAAVTLLEDLSLNQKIELMTNTNAAGETAVFAAAVAGCSKTIRSLLKIFDTSTRHKILSIPDSKGETAAYRAASGGDQETLEVLWGASNTEELKENLKVVHLNDLTKFLLPLVSAGCAETVQYMLYNMDSSKRYALLSQQDESGQTFMHIAAINGSTETIKVMLGPCSKEESFNLLSISNCDNRNVISAGSIKNQADCVVYMLSILDTDKTKELLQRKNCDGQTILYEVALNGYSEMMASILRLVPYSQYHTLLLPEDDCSSCPFFVALLNGHIDICEVILNILDLNTRNILLKDPYTMNETIFHWAALYDRSQLIDDIFYLCSKYWTTKQKIDILSSQNSIGYTALATAASRGDTEAFVSMIIAVEYEKRYTLLDIRNDEGQNAIHLAAINGHPETIQFALQMLPSVQIKYMAKTADTDNQTPTELLRKHFSVMLEGWMPEIRQKPVTMPCTEYESIQDLPIFTAFSLSQEGKKEIDTSHSQNVGDATIESSKENITGENDIHQHQKSAAENEVLPPQSMENNSSIRDVVHPDSKYIYSTYDEVPIPDMSKDILPAAAETHDIKKSTTNIKTQLTAQEETKDITQQKLLAMYTEQTSPLSTVGEHITEAADNDSSAAAAKREHPHTQEKEHKRKEKAEVQADNQYIYSTYDEVPIPGVSKDILPAPETHDNKIPTTNIKSLLARGKKTRYVIQRKLVRLTVKKSKLEKRRRKIAKESQLWKEKLKNCLEDCDVGTDHEKHTGEATVAQCQSKIEELELKQEVTNVKIYHLEKEMKDVRLELDELQTADGAEQAVDEDDEVTDDMLPDDIEIQAYGLGVQPDDPYDELYLSTSSLESDTTTTDLVPAVNIVQNIQPRLEDKIDNNLLAPSGACTEVDVTPETAEHDSTLNDNKTENMEPRIKDTIQNILVPQTAVVDPECNARQTTHRHNTDVDALDRVSHLRTEYEVQIRKLKDECTRIADELQSVKQQQTTNADMRDNSTLHDKIIELERKQQTTNVQLEEFAEKIREIETATKEAAPPQSEEGEIQECNEQQIHGGVSQQVHGGVSQQLLVVEPPPDEVDIEGHIEQQEHGPRATYIVSLWRKTEEESLWYC